MIQVLALRTYTKDGLTKTAERWFDRNIRATSVDDILQDPEGTLLTLTDEEKFNVYYTVCECLEEPGRKFLKQSVIPFDIDGLELPPNDPAPHVLARTIAKVTCEAIGVEFDEVGVVFSGNGVQILIAVKQSWDDKDYFDVARPHYKALCEKIDLKLSQHQLRGKSDPSVWSPARLMRHPATLNKKPNKPERMAVVLQPNMVALDFTLESRSGIKDVKPEDHIHPSVGNLFNNDPAAILDEKNGCDFMKYGFANPEKMPEPWWYAGVSITGRFPDAMKWTHDFSKGHPKYNFQETEIKRKQACSDKSGPRTCKHIEGLGFNCQACPNFGKVHSPIHIEGPNSIKTLNTGFRFKRKNAKGEDTNGPPDYQGLHRYFQRQNDYVSVKDAPDMFTFKSSHWERITRDDVQSFAQTNLVPMATDRERKEFSSLVKICNLVDKDFFEVSKPGFFNFLNGVYSLDDKKLLPHDRSFNFQHVLQCDFDPDAQAPRFRLFMSEITSGRKELENTLQEFMGYVISGMDCIYDRALLLVGEGENGKSKFIEVLRLLVNEKAISSIATKDMVSEVHRADLAGKILNISEESSNRSFDDTEELKKMVAGGVTRGKMLYHQPFEFRNKAKFVMLANRLPRNFDTSHGFFRRLLAIPFDAVFSKDLGNRDDRLMDKLAQEIPGIFNYAIEGFERLMQKGGFVPPQEARELIEDYQMVSDNVKSWMVEEIDLSQSDDVKTLKESLYDSYSAWCEKAGVKVVETRNRFYLELKIKMRRMGIPWLESKHEIPGSGMGRKRFLHHITFKSPDAVMINLTTREVQLYKKE